MRKGQAAIETLIILSVSLIILLVIFFASQERLGKVDRIVWETQARASLDKLSDAADFVFSQAPGTSTEVYITIPPLTREINIGSHDFEFVMAISGQNSSFNRVTTARLRGDISADSGSRLVVLKNEGPYVSVSTESS